MHIFPHSKPMIIDRAGGNYLNLGWSKAAIPVVKNEVNKITGWANVQTAHPLLLVLIDSLFNCQNFAFEVLTNSKYVHNSHSIHTHSQ